MNMREYLEISAWEGGEKSAAKEMVKYGSNLCEIKNETRRTGARLAFQSVLDLNFFRSAIRVMTL
jgi:hypothetical protein